MRYYYFLCCHFLIKRIQAKLVRIVISAEKDVPIFQSMAAHELYLKMRDVYRAGIRRVRTTSEMKEHCQALNDLDRELKEYLRKTIRK